MQIKTFSVDSMAYLNKQSLEYLDKEVNIWIKETQNYSPFFKILEVKDQMTFQPESSGGTRVWLFRTIVYEE